MNEFDEHLRKQREGSAARLMQAIQAATAQTQPAAVARVRGAKGRPSLREELYQAEFRARERRAVRAGRSK